MELTINEKLRQLRIESGLTLQDIADKLGKGGYSRMTISDIENGRRAVGWKTICDWAHACGKEPEIVFKNLKR